MCNLLSNSSFSCSNGFQTIKIKDISCVWPWTCEVLVRFSSFYCPFSLNVMIQSNASCIWMGWMYGIGIHWDCDTAWLCFDEITVRGVCTSFLCVLTWLQINSLSFHPSSIIWILSGLFRFLFFFCFVVIEISWNLRWEKQPWIKETENFNVFIKLH